MANSDYQKKNLDLFSLLPDVNKSDFSKAFFENLHNRFLTKPETEQVIGFIGTGNAAIANYKIPEPTPHRDAYQLQPTAYTKIGTVEHMMSFVDGLNELADIGVDRNKFNQWGKTQQFNWAPPIDLDKLIHFRDYFWRTSPGKEGLSEIYQTDPTRNTPQYITIKDPCFIASLKVAKFTSIIKDQTVNGLIPIQSAIASTGLVTISGNYALIFCAGFPIYVTGSSADINQSFYTVESSTYLTATNQTAITLSSSTPLSVNAVDGNIDLNAYLNVLRAEEHALCYGINTSFDLQQFDDSQVGSIIWNVDLLNSISSATQPAPPGSAFCGVGQNESCVGYLWFDTSTDTLRQSDGAQWLAVVSNFSVIVAHTTGRYPFDFISCLTEDCVNRNDWQLENRWVHRSSVNSGDQVIQAKYPIIEYLPFLELNQWTKTVHAWKYRSSDALTFTSTTAQPTLLELAPIANDTYTIIDTNTIQLDTSYGNYTESFTAGSLFKIANSSANDGTYKVISSQFTAPTVIEKKFTRIQFVRVSPIPLFSTDGLSTTILSIPGDIEPVVTSTGDPWNAYHLHWLYDSSTTTAVNNQVVNTTLYVDPGSFTYTTASGYFYRKSQFAQNLTFEDITAFNTAARTITFDTAISNVVKGGLNTIRLYHGQVAVDQIPRRVYDEVFEEIVDVDNNVTGIVLKSSFVVAAGDTLLINVGADAESDVGKQSVAVRTIESDSVFTPLTNDITGPQYVDLSQYKKAEQIKQATHQYPLFDIYHVDLTTAYRAASLFKFKESSLADLNPVIQRRIIQHSASNFEFEQELIDFDNGPLFVYKDFSIQQIAPELSPFTTIWRSNIPVSEYTPKYVDRNKQPTIIGSSAGEWELADFVNNNSVHENRKYVKSSDLLTHVTTMVAAQAPVPGIGGTPQTNFQYLLTPNYGVGGTIKEHNYGYDTTMSALLVNNVTVPQLIQFAQTQYEGLLNEIRGLVFSNLKNVLLSIDPAVIVNIQQALINAVITGFEQNDFLNRVYGDTTTKPSPTVGIGNWIVTLPFLKLIDKVQPLLHIGTLIGTISDSDIDYISLLHHDGHRSKLDFPKGFINQLLASLIIAPDSRTGIGTRGIKIQRNFAAQPIPVVPSTVTSYNTLFGTTELIPGTFVSLVDKTTNTTQFYQLKIAAAGPSDPSTTLPLGSYYYKTTIDQLMVLTSGGWVAASVPSGNILPAWDRIDSQITQLSGNVLLDVEQRLYDAAPAPGIHSYDTNVVFTNPAAANQFFKKSFLSEIKAADLVAPFVNQNYDTNNPFTYNYSNPSVITQLPDGTMTSEAVGSWWENIYTILFNTPYPHLEPWMLQGYKSKPIWWDSFFKSTSSTRLWKREMWTDFILPGSIPQDKTYPDGTHAPITTTAGAPSPAGSVSSYLWVPVNVDDDVIESADHFFHYAPDDLLPPYSNGTYITIPSMVPVATYIRSLYTSVPNDPAAEFNLDLSGDLQTKYLQGSQYLYDVNILAYLNDPVKYLFFTFGEQYHDINDLLVSKRFQKVFAHNDTVFHGEIYNGVPLLVNGLNQWYVNFNRYNGYDIGSSEFYDLWKSWKPTLTYQFGRYIDDAYLSVLNRNFDISATDYAVTSKLSRSAFEKQIDALTITLQKVPPSVLFDRQEDRWSFVVSNNNIVHQSLEYYLSKSFQADFDFTANKFIISKFAIIAPPTTNFNRKVRVAGNATIQFEPNNTAVIEGSLLNNGSYVVEESLYDLRLNVTDITLTTPLVGGFDGTIRSTTRTLPRDWVTGTEVFLQSTQYIPSELNPNTRYYLIRIDSHSFNIARSRFNADDNIPIVPTDKGYGLMYVSEINNGFVSLDGANNSDIWYVPKADRSQKRSLLSNSTFNTVQGLIDFIVGYQTYATDQGFVFNFENKAIDTETGRVINWQLEIERLIDWAFLNRKGQFGKADTYLIHASATDSMFVFDQQSPAWVTGTKIILDTNGTLPQREGANGIEPLIVGVPYYVIRVDSTKFLLADTLGDANLGNFIVLTSDTSGDTFARLPNVRIQQPKIEINPFRYDIWVRHDLGLLANVLQGPFEENLFDQTIYDQYGKRILIDNLFVYRSDRMTRIHHKPGVLNLEQRSQPQTPYRDLHFGGMRLFFNTYEQVILFNDYTSGNLLFDSFLGLRVDRLALEFVAQNASIGGDSDKRYVSVIDTTSTTVPIAIPDQPMIIDHRVIIDGESVLFAKVVDGDASVYVYTGGQFVEVDTARTIGTVVYVTNGTYTNTSWIYNGTQWVSSKYTLRPNVGGYFLKDGKLVKNFEAQTNLQRYLYDTYYPNEKEQIIKYSRALLGYDEKDDQFLIGMGLNSKTKFLFWKAMVQNKGTVNSVTAFINSRRFVGAEVDEFWAFKVAEFGGSTKFKFPQLKISLADLQQDSVRYDFLSADEPQTQLSTQNQFTPIRLGDITRWYNQPEQSILLGKEGKLFFDCKLTSVKITETDLLGTFINPKKIEVNDQVIITWYDTTTNTTQVLAEADTAPVDFTYKRHNHTLIELNVPSGHTIDEILPLKVYFVNPDKDKHNPLRILDTKSNVKVADVILWDPVRGHDYAVADREIDVKFGNVNSLIFDPQNDHPSGFESVGFDSEEFDDQEHLSTPQMLPGATVGSPPARLLIDPARYNTYGDVHYIDTSVSSSPWGTDRVGTIWLDTSTISYKPYYDLLINNLQTNLDNWGKLADWADINVYQWTKSDVLPESWDEQALKPDPTSLIQKTGTAKKVLLSNVGTADSPTWVVDYDQHKVVYVAIAGLDNSTTAGNRKILFNAPGSTIEIYVNDTLATQTTVDPEGYVVIPVVDEEMPLLTSKDVIRLVKRAQFISDFSQYATPYTVTYKNNPDGTQTPEYYFWVQNKTSKAKNVPMVSLPSLLSNPDIPYALFTNPSALTAAPQFISNDPSTKTAIPVHYSQTIIKKLGTIVSEDDRYTLMFTVDHNLRDSLNAGLTNERHAEWHLIRKEQTTNIPRSLWDKVTEAIIGHSLLDPTVVLPSIDRVLYDTLHQTTLRYGIGSGQAIVNGDHAKESVLTYLLDPNHQFDTIGDIQVYLANNNFDTEESTIDLMDQIFTLLGTEHVNRMFFEIIEDAMANNTRYKDIFKTSLVACHGIKLLETIGELEI